MDNMLKYQKAVNYRGGNVAVSASAGCGKTTTMIKRIEDIITKEKISVTELLVVTFTRAAAAEMKQKLKNALIQYPKDSFEYSQSFCLDLSDISTIHSFCSKVCSEFFSVADLPPDFTIMEENDAVIYKKRILNNVIEEYYEKNDAVFNELSRIYSYDRSDSGIIATVERLYTLIVNLPDAEKYLDEYAFCCCNADISKNPAAIILNNDLFEAANGYLHDFSLQKSLCVKNGLMANVKLFEQIIEALSTVDKHKSLIDNIIFLENTLTALKARISSEKKLEPDSYEQQLHNRTKELKSSAKASFEKIYKNILPIQSEDVAVKLNIVKTYLQKICEITKTVYTKYKQFKKDNALLDFNDLEYYTYKVLQNPSSAEVLKTRYRYIFVDEFQDTNRVQDEIINRLENGGNLFIVGDFKQSIYRFRGAENEIFKEKTQSNSFEEITLGTNFRSDKNLLNFVNEVFSLVMKESFSLINYSLNGILKGDNVYTMTDGRPSVIVDVLPSPETTPTEFKGIYSVKKHAKADKADEESRAANEGRHIATEILKLVNNKVKLVLNDNELKKRQAENKDEYICYSDITILVRTKKAFSQRIYTELQNAKIPVSAEFSYSINNYFEITQILNYLKLIDNFNQDIPLLASLSGPFGNFSDDEIAKIRISSRKGLFYEAFLEYITGKDELAQKFKIFRNKTQEYALLSKIMPCPRLVMKIIKDFKYEEYLYSLKNGEEYAERVNTFLNIIYQKTYSYDITEFLYYIENAADEIKLNGKSGAELNKVRLCTIHTSKGLEYPIVFVAGCGERFLFLESRQKLVMHTKYGLAMDYYDYDSRTVEKTYIRNALSLMQDYEQVKEEINTLYVAMTRAKYRLYLCGTTDAEKYSPLSGIYSIKNSKNYFDFILNVAMQDGKNYGKTEKYFYFNKNFGIDYEFNINPTIEKTLNSAVMEKTDKKEITPLCDYKYYKSTLQPFKNTVTALNRYTTENEESQEEHTSFALFGKDYADIGTTYHKILAEIDFNIKPEDIPAFIKSQISCKLITKEQAKEIDVNLISNVLKLPLFNNIQTNWREVPFISLSDCLADKTEDEILLQGVIDLLIINENKVTIVDYKYSSHKADYLKEKYAKQLDLYAKAAEKILGYKTTKKAIINIKTSEMIALD